MTQILAFGDSITYGACDKEGGWVTRLRKFLDIKNISLPKSDFTIYNLGVSGDTAEDLLERFEFETKQRSKENEETIFIFAIGVNDSQFIHSQNGLRFSPQKFQDNIQKLVKIAKKFSSKIIFVGLFPVDESKTNPTPWNKDKSYKNKDVQKNNEIIKTICKENDINFVEIYDRLTKVNYKSLLEDGLHPNSKGHEKIFEIVKDQLIKNKII